MTTQNSIKLLCMTVKYETPYSFFVLFFLIGKSVELEVPNVGYTVF